MAHIDEHIQKAKEAFKEEVPKQAGRGIFNFLKKVAGETGIEILGILGYHQGANILRKMMGQETEEHHEEAHGDAGCTLKVDQAGRGKGDEQGMMQEIAAIRGHMGVTEAEADRLIAWLQTKHKKLREDFRCGYFQETDQSKRLRFLTRLAKMPDAQKDSLLAAAGHEAPHDHKKDIIKELNALLLETNVWLTARNRNRSPIVRINNWLRPLRMR